MEDIRDNDALEKLKVKYLGRKGELTAFLRKISGLNEEERKEIGRLANDVKKEITERFGKAAEHLKGGEESSFFDPTLPGKKAKRGHLHPITQTQDELEDIFRSMGFMVLDGPEMESDYYNFEALNIPDFHPARDMQDTFYVDLPDNAGKASGREKGSGSGLVMRTHTSPMQVRAMKEFGAPLRCVVPGRTFRNEEIDACHEHTFDQMEGLLIGEGISLSNLIAVMKELINGIFKEEVNTRIRPGYFPFVEPGIEMDIECRICSGAGCPSCKNSGWLELLPAGMIHPKVLEYGNIDPKAHSGFAFGLGLTRLAMMKYGIDDIRLFNSGDLRFLEQF